MTARAHVEFDHSRFGVKIAIQPREGEVVIWPDALLTVRRVEEGGEEQGDAWLGLDDDVARALYEALADHFGHSGHDTRALRRDYDAERGRVDRLIDAVIKGLA